MNASRRGDPPRETPIAFESCGAALRGRLLLPPQAASPRPALVMAHGTSATVEMVMVEYARAFARAGFAALVDDHRNFGGSDGEPRGEINPWIQCRGYIDAIGCARSRPEVDPCHIGLWGDSYSAGEAVVVAACDRRVELVVGQCPVFGAEAPAAPPNAADFAVLRQTLLEGDVLAGGTSTGPLPVVSFDPLSLPSLLLPIQAFRWFVEYGGRPGSGWANRVSRILPPTPVPYSPFLCAPFVEAAVLLMVAPDDEMRHAAPAVARRAWELMPGHKRWHDISDGHFGLLYQPGPRFDEAVAVQTGFLRERWAGL